MVRLRCCNIVFIDNSSSLVCNGESVLITRGDVNAARAKRSTLRNFVWNWIMSETIQSIAAIKHFVASRIFVVSPQLTQIYQDFHIFYVTGFGYTHTRQQAELFLFLFYFIYFISPTATLLGRRLHHHLPVAEVAPHGRGPLAAGGQSARRSWLMGRLSAQRWWGWFSGCCRTRWHDEIGELSFPTT